MRYSRETRFTIIKVSRRTSTLSKFKKAKRKNEVGILLSICKDSFEPLIPGGLRQMSVQTIANGKVEYYALDLLTAVASRVPELNRRNQLIEEHRVSCHRCGNIRKKKFVCTVAHCPHIFCGRCVDKMKEEYGPSIFVSGCPVCKGMCCCHNKAKSCQRTNHCYRKCPATKYGSKPQRHQGDNYALDFLAAVADASESNTGDIGSYVSHNSSELVNANTPISLLCYPIGSYEAVNPPQECS